MLAFNAYDSGKTTSCSSLLQDVPYLRRNRIRAAKICPNIFGYCSLAAFSAGVSEDNRSKSSIYARIAAHLGQHPARSSSDELP
jgi:hypothetical protein